MKSEFCDNFTIKYEVIKKGITTGSERLRYLFLRQTENRFTRFAETSILQVCCRGSFI